MTRFIAFSHFKHCGLHVWREGTQLKLHLEALQDASLPPGFCAFECELGAEPLEKIWCLLFDWNEDGTGQTEWEKAIHAHEVPRIADTNRLPRTVWLFQGSARAVGGDPPFDLFEETRTSVRVHLITASKYVNAELFTWNAPGIAASTSPASGRDDSGPFWDLDLSGPNRSYLQFKFRRSTDKGTAYEGDVANRLWVATDGTEVWTHSEAREVVSQKPVRRQLIIHARQEIDPAHPPRMHIWQESSDFITDVSGEAETGGWTAHRVLLYTGLPYRVMFRNPSLPADQWENTEAIREIVISGDEERWTLEGDRHLFAAEPLRNCHVNLIVAAQPPGYELLGPLAVDVWVNRARAPLPGIAGLRFTTYPDVVTSVRVRGANSRERIDRHPVVGEVGATIDRWAVLGRPPLLPAAPVGLQFTDPPFPLRRPGAFEETGHVRFVLHAPTAAHVELVGDWMAAGARQPMASTRDGTYWWTQIPAVGMNGGKYHGRHYHYCLNGDPRQRVQDPAAGWVDRSDPSGDSRLVRRGEFQWSDQGWQTPTWDWLRLYQLHPARFTRRGPAGATPLDRVAWELDAAEGYLRQVHVTALQLMPINEVGTTNSWGYDPAFFYAVETSYGGPDALKRLVDTCHRRGVAVLLDVVFNHGGTTDNILWPVARGSFFDGDTAWGAMINYDHPQAVHFFEQNLVYLLEEFHVDGFRFDFTRVIIHGHEADEAHVRQPGSGGGWEFLQKLRAAARAVNPNCIFIAEHLPNEWGVTNADGAPLDSQWCDDFHDRLKDACSGDAGAISSLATAMKLTHADAGDWYKATMYAESHDEVGNENGRIANVAGFGRGWRMVKVAAAVTLLSRSIPMLFMGGESGEHRQFYNGSQDTLDLQEYLQNASRGRIRAWFNRLLELRSNSNIKGPSPVRVTYAQDQQLGFLRGQSGEYFALANFGGWSGWKSLAHLNVPEGTYRELWNSTWPAFAVEDEDEHTNGGREARLGRGNWLSVPDYGVVILERC